MSNSLNKLNYSSSNFYNVDTNPYLKTSSSNLATNYSSTSAYSNNYNIRNYSLLNKHNKTNVDFGNLDHLSELLRNKSQDSFDKKLRLKVLQFDYNNSKNKSNKLNRQQSNHSKFSDLRMDIISKSQPFSNFEKRRNSYISIFKNPTGNKSRINIKDIFIISYYFF